MAIKRPDGSLWTTSAGLAWVNPYDRRVWDYAVSVAASAARAGFDEIMLDYVRFPSDGDVGSAVYPGRTSVPKGELIASFVAYAKQRLAPLGVRVSTALFGLSATRDMGIGQVPRWISQHVDHVHPMAYPGLYGGGELGIVTPSAEPGETVFRTLVDFKQQVKGSRRAADPVDPGLELPAASRCCSRCGPRGCRGRRGTCSGTRRACTRRPRSRLPREPAHGASLTRDQPSPARS